MKISDRVSETGTKRGLLMQKHTSSNLGRAAIVGARRFRQGKDRVSCVTRLDTSGLGMEMLGIEMLGMGWGARQTAKASRATLKNDGNRRPCDA